MPKEKPRVPWVTLSLVALGLTALCIAVVVVMTIITLNRPLYGYEFSNLEMVLGLFAFAFTDAVCGCSTIVPSLQQCQREGFLASPQPDAIGCVSGVLELLFLIVCLFAVIFVCGFLVWKIFLSRRLRQLP